MRNVGSSSGVSSPPYHQTPQEVPIPGCVVRGCVREIMLHSGVCAFMVTRAILPETSRAQQAQALLLRAEAVSEDI